MLYRRFSIICLISMAFGIAFANAVQSNKSGRQTGQLFSLCSPATPEACTRHSF